MQRPKKKIKKNKKKKPLTRQDKWGVLEHRASCLVFRASSFVITSSFFSFNSFFIPFFSTGVTLNIEPIRGNYSCFSFHLFVKIMYNVSDSFFYNLLTVGTSANGWTVFFSRQKYRGFAQRSSVIFPLKIFPYPYLYIVDYHWINYPEYPGHGTKNRTRIDFANSIVL